MGTCYNASFNSPKKIMYAEVAELVDAHDSGSCVRKDVGVRVSPSAPVISMSYRWSNF